MSSRTKKQILKELKDELTIIGADKEDLKQSSKISAKTREKFQSKLDSILGL